MKYQNQKIGVVTLYGEFNFGNRLQNYAIHKYIDTLGFRAETLVAKNKLTLKKRCIDIAKKICITLVPNYILKTRPHWIRKKIFKEFTKKHILTRYINSKDCKLPDSISNEYNYFIIGSDQVWNPTFGEYEKLYHNMFLLFTAPEKKLCFSPSIGISEIPLEWQEKFSNGFKTFPTLSVRENTGAKIIQNLSGMNAEVLIDPTLMLTADEWEKISLKANVNADKYIFEYFLGEYDDDTESIINSELKENVERIKILDQKNGKIYASGPSEFIYMIKNATLVCTDSFHACVFSIIFDVPFIILKRKGAEQNMYSRIETLLKLFEVEFQYGKPILIDKDLKDKVLKVQRDKVDRYFKNCINNGGSTNVH